MNQNLCETSISDLEKIHEHLKSLNENEMNSFELIGIHISIFTIFEEFSTHLIDDFKKYLDEDISKIFLLPKTVLDSMSANISGGGDQIIHKYSEKKIRPQIVSYFYFQHFNKTNLKASERKIDEILQPEKPFYKNLELEKILTNLDVPTSHITFGNISSKSTTSASLFISEYSEDVRHIIAHKKVTSDNIQIFKNNYPSVKVIENFKIIIQEIYCQYNKNHNRHVYIEQDNIDTIDTTI